ncbi:MAG: hypothetical protein DMG11_18795 [Acidobacteria bacterium]|nr:MAG: hypothetical protein DMG11_18795 [Acidobacteriota bacterium]
MRSFKPAVLEAAPAVGFPVAVNDEARVPVSVASLTAFFPWTHAAIVCHSGSFAEVKYRAKPGPHA